MSDHVDDAGGDEAPLFTDAAAARRPIRCDGERVTTLREALELFFAMPGPRRIAAYSGAAWAARAMLGRPRASDAFAAAAVVAWWPFQEWLAHKRLLHLEPKHGDGPLFARRHRAHHVEPREVDLTLLPIEVLDVAMPANAILWLVMLGPRRAAVTGIAAFSTMALVYEWTHFLVHTGYKPKSSFFKRVRKNHRLHHYRSEKHWLGFTLPWVDDLLGTAPDPRSVPFSETARDLFGLRARAARSTPTST